MKLFIQVFVEFDSKIRNDVPDLGAWDYYGVSEALNTVLPSFPASSFVTPAASRSVAHSIDGKYNWETVVADIDLIDAYEITQFPAIFLFDTDSNKYVGQLQGSPKNNEDVKQLFSLFSSLLNTYFGNKMKTRHVTLSFSALAFLTVPFFKQKNQKLAAGVVGGGLLAYSVYDYYKENGSNTEESPQYAHKNILFFTSPSCGACRQLKPKVDAIAQQFGATIILIDSSTEGGAASHREAGITVLPVIVVTDDNNTQLKRWDGGITAIAAELPRVLS
jgi:thiol-disulfide isomerase/thioredoxin